jgi:hypothetical protein
MNQIKIESAQEVPNGDKCIKFRFLEDGSKKLNIKNKE